MIKKFVTLLLAITLILPSYAISAFDDVPLDAPYAKSVERLVQYGIFSGNPDGTFEPHASLTRAQMAKISTIVFGLDSLAAANYGTSLYSDIDGSYWASGYVNVAAKNNLILGYPNGTYAPEKPLTFAETVTIILRLLGYTPDKLGDNWPWAYTAKAVELGLTEGLDYGENSPINRGDVALMLDRALLMDMDKEGSQPAKKLIELMGYTLTDELIVLGTSNVNKNLLYDEVSTTAGTFKKLNSSVDNYVTRKVKLVLNEDSKIVNVLPMEQVGKDIVIQTVVGVELAYTEGEKAGSMKFDNTSVIYYQGMKKTFQEVKSNMQIGMTMSVYYSENGAYDYAVIKDFEMQGPVTVRSSLTGTESSVGGISIQNSGIRVIKDGFESSLSDIKAFDIIYYNPVSNILYAYSDKVTGVYEKALPSKASVSSIQLSGKTYNLETQAAVKALGEYPSAYSINDYVTLLLGKDGEVADVIRAGTDIAADYGIILSSQERVSEDKDDNGNTYHYVTTMSMTGLEQEFKTDADYSNYRGRVVKYEFKDGFMIPKFISPAKISGTIDKNKGTIGNLWLTNETKLIDLMHIPQKHEPEPATAAAITLSDISATSITEGNVVHAEIDPKYGEIKFIVFSNITMNKYQYGIVTDIQGSSYTLNINGVSRNYSSSRTKYSVQAGQAVMANIQNNSLRELKTLYQIPNVSDVGSIDVQRIRVGKENYKLAPDVSVYMYKDFKYYLVNISDLSSYTLKNLKLYADKAPSAGGLIRVIVFNN